MRVQIPVRGIRSPDGGSRHRGIFRKAPGRVRHRGIFRSVTRKAKRARTTPGGFPVGNSKGKAGAIDIEGFFERLLDEIGTGGVFANGDRRMALLFKEYPQSLGAIDDREVSRLVFLFPDTDTRSKGRTKSISTACRRWVQVSVRQRAL